MAKKPLSVSIRKASSAPQNEPKSDARASDKDAFVVGGKPGFRAMTLYLPDALVEKLTAHCLKNNQDMSALVAEIMEKHLAGLEQPKPEPKADDVVTTLRKWVEKKFPRVASLRPAFLGMF